MRTFLHAVVASAWVLVLSAGCEKNSEVCVANCGGDDAGPMHTGVDAGSMHVGVDAGSDGGELDAGEILPMTIVSLAIAPADPALDCTDGTPPAQDFQLIATYGDGSTRAVAAVWRLDHDRLGQIRSDGRFVAREGCVASGTTNVHAEFRESGGGLRLAQTTITVRVTAPTEYVGLAASDAPEAHFTGTPVTDAARAPHLAYPLDGAIMPNNVLPPDIQWDRGDAGDVFRVTITNATLSITSYVRHTGSSFHYDWTPSRALWRTASENYTDEPFTVGVDVWDASANEVVSGPAVTIRLTRSSISGNVYYWDTSLPSQKIFRINAFDGTRSIAIPSSPGNGCQGCHSVSPNGRYMAMMLGGGDPASRGTVYDLSRDLSGPSPPTEFPPQFSDPMGARWATAAWSPDSTRIMYSEGLLRLLNPRTGERIATTLPTENYYGLTWAPDNSAITMGSMLEGVTWFHLYTAGNLVQLPVTGPDTFGTPRLLHDATTLSSMPEGGRADSHPTYSPDSRVIVFQHGDEANTDHGSSTVDQWTSAALYVMKSDGSSVTRLTRAMSGMNRDYRATFLPFVASEGSEFGGYYWLAFSSGRPYGNAQAGVTGHRQIWVTAIHVDAHDGEDPSSVPFWLPGQDVHGHNIAAQWAPLACRASDESCSASSECCSGNCAPAPAGGTGFTCQPPPPSECRPRGASCSADGDCCSGLSCLGNTCLDLPI